MKRYLHLAMLAATVFVGAFLAYSIWRATPRTAQQFFSAGKSYYEQKKYQEATIEFLNALRKDPRNRDAQYLLAESYLAQQNVREAVKQLSSLLEYYPDDIPASLQLGNLYLAGSDIDPKFVEKARQIAENILAKEPRNVLAHVLLGNAMAGLQDYGSSLTQFEEALKGDPHNAAIYINLATTRTLQKNYPEAEKAFLKARQIDPKNRTALTALANYYRSAGRTNEAEATIKELVAAYPSDKDINLQMATFYYQTGRFEQAEQFLKDQQSSNAKDPGPSILLASLYWAKNRPSDARNLLTDLKAKFPQDLEVAVDVAQTFLEDQPERARKEIDQILKSDPKRPIGHILLGELQFYSGQYDDAETTLGNYPAVNSSFPAVHYLLGRIAAAKGQADQAQEHYQKSLKINAAYAPTRLALADLLLKKGRIADARVEVRKALEVQGDSISARLLEVGLNTADKKYADAERELNTLVKEYPAEAAIHHQMGLFYQARGLNRDAEKSFEHALELRPDSNEILQSLAQLYAFERQVDRAIQVINDTVPDAKKQAFHYELLGVMYSTAGKGPEAEAAYKKALEKEPGRAKTNELLIVHYIQARQFDQAHRKLDEILKKDPSHAEAFALQGSIFQGEGNIEAAKANYTQSLKVDPNTFIAANNLAYLLAEEGRELDAALNWAQTARRREPEDPNAADSLGWVQHKLGRDVLARDQLRFAVSKQPDNPIFQYHLAMIYKETKQINEAQAALKKALAAKTDFKEKSLAEASLKELAKLK